MSVKDLKFPPLYNIEWIRSLPKPNYGYICNNHVQSAFSFIDAGKINEYSAILKRAFAESRQPNEDFNEWFWRYTGCLDSSEFNENGKLVRYMRNCFMCGSLDYKYDSLGFVVYRNTGSDAIINYYFHYSFYPIKRTLYYCDTGIRFSSEMNVERLHFDSSGYLTSSEYKNIDFGCISLTNYKYNEHLQISKIERWDSIIRGSEHSKEPWPITIGSISTYYYTSKYPDSITINYIVNTQQDIHHTQKIYFDSIGLPVKSVYINFPGHHKVMEVRKYRYH